MLVWPLYTTNNETEPLEMRCHALPVVLSWIRFVISIAIHPQGAHAVMVTPAVILHQLNLTPSVEVHAHIGVLHIA